MHWLRMENKKDLNLEIIRYKCHSNQNDKRQTVDISPVFTKKNMEI